MNRSTISWWNPRFQEDRTSVRADQRIGRPRTRTAIGDISTAIVTTMNEKDRGWKCFEAAEEANISTTYIHSILTEILMKRKFAARWGPHLLSVEQKN